MKKMKKSWLVPLLITVVILIVGGLYMGSLPTKENTLSESDIRTQLENSYGGTIDTLSMESDIYIAEMTRNGVLYSAEIDAVTGRVLSLVQLSKSKEKSPQVLSEDEAREIIAQKYTGEIERILLHESGEPPVYEVEIAKEQALVTVIIDALAGEITSEIIKETTVDDVLITREQAIEIALGQLRGEVEYVVFEQTEEGGYYLVEIEQDDDDGDDLEAIFQIHAISGEILSVTWDD